MGNVFLNSVFLLLILNFVRGSRLERKHQFKAHSCPWLYDACPAVTFTSRKTD